MAADVPTGTPAASRRERFVGWIDPSLVGLCLGSLAVVVAGALVQVSFGAYSMTVLEAWRAVFDPAVVLDHRAWRAFLLGPSVPVLGAEMPAFPNNRSLVVWTIRLPRVFVAILVGANLAISGAIFQAVTRNELASPFVLGVSSGAGLAILLSLVIVPSTTVVVPILVGFVVFDTTSLLPLFAALGGVVAFVLVYVVAWKGGTSPVRLVLAGVIVSAVFDSLQRALFFFADDLGTVQSALAWITGSLTGTQWEEVRLALPWTLLATLLALVAARQLNVLLLGQSTAQSLGMNVERVRFALSGVAVLAAAASISVAGIVGFVGLIVPHVVRNVVGSNYRKLMVGCLFVGPALLVAADVVARLALNPVQLPVGIVTGLIGGPYFLYLMRRTDRIGEI